MNEKRKQRPWVMAVFSLVQMAAFVYVGSSAPPRGPYAVFLIVAGVVGSFGLALYYAYLQWKLPK